MKFGYHGEAKAIDLYSFLVASWHSTLEHAQIEQLQKAACGVWVHHDRASHPSASSMAAEDQGCLRKGARAALQFYPETASQAGSQLSAHMSSTNEIRNRLGFHVDG